MRNKGLLLSVFGAMVVAQIAVPCWMIAQRERTLREGRLYRFRTAPVDPYDAFRGKYVALRLEQGTLTNRYLNLSSGQKVFGALDEDTNGFARIREVRPEAPSTGDYVKARVRYAWEAQIVLDLPFDRYYMEETRAPSAERAYWQHSRRQTNDTWVAVRVRSGDAALEELFIAGRPIREFLREERTR